jgi:hypothetical protein
MTLQGFESPFQIILGQNDCLALTPEQRRTLELLDMDFRSEIIRLSSKRQLLELDALRSQVDSPSGLGLTAKSLAAVDAATAKLRQRWLLAQEQARATLSAEQLTKLPKCAGKLPTFDFDLDRAAPVSPELEARVAEILSARIKDAKVVEVETAQAIAERLFSWTKTAAIAAGVPLALLAVVLGVLGVSNWADFKTRLAEGKKEVEAQLATARQTANEIRAQGTALQAQYADLKKQFGDVSTLANDVRGLSEKVERLEQIRFEQPSALLPEIQVAVEQRIKDYRTYLQSLGYHLPTKELRIAVVLNGTDNAFYDGEKFVISANLITIPEIIYREYNLRMLVETNPSSWNAMSWKAQAILSGLADYFSCSYQGEPKFGEKYVEILGDKSPAEFRKRGFLRNLANNRLFPTDAADPVELEEHAAGEVWGGVFWDLRTILGCKADSAKCVTADKIAFAGWTALKFDPIGYVDVRLAQYVVQNVRETFGAEQASKIREAFARRGLALAPQ